MDEPNLEPRQFHVCGLPYEAFEEPDLRWLPAYGRVFRIYDQLFSGNLCFGVDGPYGKLFIKYAGAKTVRYRGKTRDAVIRLRNGMQYYESFSHPALTRLLAHGQVGDGYAAVFAWRNAYSLHPSPFDPSVRDAVRRLPVIRALKMLDMVFDLHAQLAANGIIAVDFSDANILIDFETDEAIVCDVDLYRRKPAFNDRGRMWGSTRFLSPEEYTLGAPLEETTTAYNMGALAFEFFGNNEDRAKKSWIGPSPLFEVAQRATKEAKSDRYPSMRAFIDSWREAVGRCKL